MFVVGNCQGPTLLHAQVIATLVVPMLHELTRLLKARGALATLVRKIWYPLVASAMIASKIWLHVMSLFEKGENT